MTEISAEVRKNALRWLRRETFGNLFLIALLFGAAGTWHWPMGWALCGVYLLWSWNTGVLILPRNPDMLAERARPHPGTKKWDFVLLGLMGVFMLAEYLVASLDLRFGWTQPFSLPVQIAGLVFAVVGYDILTVWAMVMNPFFVATMRIQSDRGQTVVATGPYRFVRHPGYLGTIMLHLGVPFMLNSSWAIIPGLLGVAVLILRTYLEDQALQTELPGYHAYTQIVRYRLIPDIW